MVLALAVLQPGRGTADDPSDEADSEAMPGPAPRPEAVRIRHEPAGEAPALGPRHAPVTAELFFEPGHGAAH